MYSVEIRYDNYGPLSLKGVWQDEYSAVNNAWTLAHSLDGDFRAIVIKQWDNGQPTEIGRINDMNH